ncbi:hypothetical protein HK100_001896 [Physocladia obscura]|uniref:Uncharacterized protein n=1 Tax=Physocladia obscura TaxID=109957 RepID=A0AAD5SWK4_9FUNG|nr:hypothetical protein HK100_001896 [Physocladia obscura]
MKETKLEAEDKEREGELDGNDNDEDNADNDEDNEDNEEEDDEDDEDDACQICGLHGTLILCDGENQTCSVAVHLGMVFRKKLQKP